MPQTMFVLAEKSELTKIGSSESKQESASVKTVEKPSQIPKLDSKKFKGLEIPQKQLHGILKETDSQTQLNISPEEVIDNLPKI